MSALSVKKYIQMKRELLSHMAQKGMSAGDRLPCEEELARMFSVSGITVRRTLRELAGDGIVERQQGKGTFLRKNVNVKTAKAGTILFGMLGGGPFPLAYTEMFRKECESRGYEMRLLWSQSKDRSELIEAAGAVDGIFVSGEIGREEAAVIQALTTPYMVIGDTLEEVKAVHARHDWDAAATLVTETLIDKGARKIAFINGGRRYAPAFVCARAFSRVCQRHGLGSNSGNIVWTTRAEWKNNIPPFFNSHPLRDFDAVICEEGIYTHFTGYLLANGVRMGEPPLAVLSGITGEENYYGKLIRTVFKESIFSLGVDALIKLMAGEKISKGILLRPEIVSIND
jgi:hypothetical protein